MEVILLFPQFHQLKMIGISFAKFIHALDLMGGKIGEKTIQLIFDNTDPNEGDWVREDRLTSINGIAETTAITFIIGMSEYWMKNFNDSILVRISYIKSPKQEVIGDKYKGQRICFTSCRPSKELRSEIESQSREVVDGVSKNTTLLVVKDASEKTMKSSKAVKAKELGIKIVTLNQL